MNGYIGININGQQVGIKFGFLAIKEFSLAADKKKDVYYQKVVDDTGEEEDTLTFLGMAKLIQCGYKNSCEIKEVDPTLTLEDFNNWTEDAMSSDDRKKELADVLNVFAQSQYVKTLQDLPNDDEAKKKNSKTTTKKLKAKS